MIVATCAAVAFVFLVFSTMQASPKPLSFVSASKETAKRIARVVKRRIYYEATIHNPEGDTLPDAWDDEILGFIKKIF